MKSDEFYISVQEIRILAAVLSKLVRQDLEQHLEMCGAPIGALQYGVLILLSYQHQTISELSRKLMLESATLVPVIDSLEHNGTVERRSDPVDRRRTPLFLTPHGVKLVRSVPAFGGRSGLAKSLERMGTEKNKRLRSLLRELTTNLTGNERLVLTISESIRQQIGRERAIHRRPVARPRKRQERKQVEPKTHR